MAHNFAISLNEEPGIVLKKIESYVTSGGGSFRGDIEKGMFEGPSIAGMIKGEYKCLTGNEIIITITDKPFIVPYSMIEAEIRRFLC